METCHLIISVFLVCCFPAISEQHINHYDGYRVFRIIPTTKEHIHTLNNLEKQIKLDVWRRPHSIGGNYDVMVTPQHFDLFIEHLTRQGMKFSVLIHDVEKLFSREREQMKRRRRAVSTLREYTTDFLSFPQIEQFLTRVKNSRTEPNVDLYSIGKSSEGRDLIVAKIYKPSRRQKPEIFIDAGIHAREWIAPATAINIIYKLAFNPEKDPEVTEVLDKFDWYIMPVANPDGYQYTIDHDRLWRKTRSHNIDSVCRGVDANRNFNYSWNPDIGGSLSPCEDVFSGTRPFSVPESRYLGEFLRSHGNRIKLYLSMHSFGQYFLYPWGYSEYEYAADADDMDRLARVANRSMARDYRIGPSAAVLYPAAGASYDYAKGAAGIKYSYTMELPPRDNGFNSYTGFTLPYDEIYAIASDSWNGIKGLALYLNRILFRSSAHVVTNGERFREVLRTSTNGDLRFSTNSAEPARVASGAGSLNSRTVYSSHSGLNEYIQSLPKYLRAWFIRHLNQMGRK